MVISLLRITKVTERAEKPVITESSHFYLGTQISRLKDSPPFHLRLKFRRVFSSISPRVRFFVRVRIEVCIGEQLQIIPLLPISLPGIIFSVVSFSLIIGEWGPQFFGKAKSHVSRYYRYVVTRWVLLRGFKSVI